MMRRRLFSFARAGSPAAARPRALFSFARATSLPLPARALFLVSLTVFAAEPSCNDPLQDARINALGPEVSGVPPGPMHRPGQPCLTCHGGSGPAGAELSVAGTIFQTADPKSPPFAGATVSIFDATQEADGGAPHTLVTNGAGNFYAPRDSWSPVYPLHDISVTVNGLALPTKMHTRVGRDGSCATCHFDPQGRGSPGHIYVVLEPGDLPQP